MNDSEHELRADERGGEDLSSVDERGALGDATFGLDDLNPQASERIRKFMAESTVRGGSSPSDVADLYTSQEIVDDADATAYLDRRFVHGEIPRDWRAFQDELSNAYLDGRPGVSGDALLETIREQQARTASGRSIFDDPDEDELEEPQHTDRMDERDPNLMDLELDARHAIERFIVSEVLCYGVAPYRVMQLREHLRTSGDERALQYLDLPFELGGRPDDWEQLRDRALMLRARLEGIGVDPADAYNQVDTAQPGLSADEMLREIDEQDRRR